MKVDLYTKVILTVIAVCLAVMVMRDIQIIPEAQAITDLGGGVIKVQIVSIDESPGLRWEAIPVEVEGNIPVTITNCWNPIPVYVRY